MKSEFSGKRVAVVGMARSGIGAAKLISRLGGRALVSDLKNADQLKPAIEELQASGIEVETGGHKRLLSEAFDFVVLSPGVVPASTLIAKWESDKTAVWSEFELAASVYSAKWIGVTGSNGKTTTVHLIADMLREGGMNAEMVGNIGSPWSSFLPDTKNMVFVVEVSSFQLERADKVKPYVGVVLNLFQNHLDRHSSMEEYARLKSKLVQNQTPDDITVLNGNDERVMQMSSLVSGKVVRFGLDDNFDYWIGRQGLMTRVRGDATCFLERDLFPLIGKHNELNALAATAAARAFGVDLTAIGNALKKARPVEHRIEYVATKDGVRYINDSKSTNLVATLTALDAMPDNVILLFGGRAKQESFSPLLQRFPSPVKALISFGESRAKLRSELPSILPIQEVETLRDAVALARQTARSGDTILLSPGCASFDQFNNFEDRGRMFKSFVSEL